MKKSEIPKLPNSPGCYLYKDAGEKVIYVGKAKNLKKRVLSYFLNKEKDPKTEALVKNISKIDFIVTNSETEALLLENNLIKKFKPKYNIDLKDSKSYSVIALTNESFPRLLSLRTEGLKNKKTNSKIYGPFTSGKSRDLILETLNKTFKLRTCKRLPKKKCIRYDLGLCSAPCINKISKEEYNNEVKNAELVLKGKTTELIKKLEKGMKKSSKTQDYEKALLLREKINSLENLNEKQSVERDKSYDEDILNFIVDKGKVYLALFNIHRGTLENKETYEFNQKNDFLEEFLLQYYSENKVPKRIILPTSVSNSLKEAILKLSKRKIEFINPKQGELKILLDLVKKNIEIQFFGNLEKVESLQKTLSLEFSPKVVECFDISHLSGTEVVASMVQFRNGKPDKTNYRKFKIKSFTGNDDFRAMNEVVKRRYSKLKLNNEPFPDIVIIDGGAGQLSSSIKALQEINVKLPVISLAKRLEEVYMPDGKIIRESLKDKGLLYLREIRDEAHRFAVKFQRERRSKRFFEKIP